MRRFLIFGKPKPAPEEEAPRTFTDGGPVSGSVSVVIGEHGPETFVSSHPADKMIRRPADKGV
jgi:hypothetical protein